MFNKVMENKYIVPILYVISSLLITLYYCFFNFDLNSIGSALAMLLYLLIPPVVYKIFRLKPVPRLSNTILIFSFFAFGIGVALHMYHTWDPWYDKVVHVFSGYMFAMIGMCGFYYMKRDKVIDPDQDLPTSVVFASTFSISIGVIWEIFEFTSDQLIESSDTQRVPSTGVTDTMLDLIADTLGAFIAAYFLWRFIRKGKENGLMIRTFKEFFETNIAKNSK